jgi:protein disulfide-isomerase
LIIVMQVLMNRNTPGRSCGRAEPWLLIVAVLAVMGGLWAWQTLPSGPVPGDGTSYDAALQTAAQSDKPVLMIFTADWCPPCKMMKRRVWPDGKVASLIEQRFVPVKVDLTDRKPNPLADRYQVQYIPTIVVTDATGSELARGSTMDADAMVAFLNDALAG